MKKGIILLALIFGACVNLENVGSNSGGDIKEIKTTNINTTKNYEKRNGVLYVDNVLANGKQEYKEKNGVVIRGNYREGLPDGVQERYYPSGKIYGKINIINNKTEGTETNYYENGNPKAYGKYASMQTKVKIGIWHYFDVNGKETQVNEEAKLGKWTFNAILEVLHKDGVIDLYTGKNRDWNKLYIEFKNNNRKVAVIVFKERIDILIDTYYKYIFNCKTGKYTRKEYERYNENAMDMPTLPPLKNSKENKRKRKNSISISEEEY